MFNFLIILVFFVSQQSYGYNSSAKSIQTSGCVQLDYLARKTGEIEPTLPCFFLKETNIAINSIYNNELSCHLNFKFCPHKIEFLIKEAYISINKPHLELRLGKLYPYYNLEDATLSTNRLFMEKASLQGFEEHTLFGMMINLKSKKCNFLYYLLTPEISPLNKKNQTAKFSSFARFFINFSNKTNFLHLGINYKEIRKNRYDDNKNTSVSITDTPFFLQAYPYSRTCYASLPNYRVIGYEGIAILDSLYIQAELAFSRAGWKDFDPELYESVNIQAAYIFTGEKHMYDKNTGTVKNPQPLKKIGALELAARYSFTNTTSKNALISGICKTDSIKNTFNVGINWYLDKNITLQFNYACESIIYRLIDDKKIQSIGAGIRFTF